MKIQHVKIETTLLEAQFQFYTGKLGLTCIHKTTDSFTIRFGSSLLQFEASSATLSSVYHLAFNIIPAQLQAAMDYLTERSVSLLKHEQQSVIDFPDWNARSVYFKDADGNILEFIARFNLSTDEHNMPFAENQILCISEVGLPVADTRLFIDQFRRFSTIHIWKSYGETFCAAGGEEGLLIVVQEPRNWFPVQVPAHQLPMDIVLQQPGQPFSFGSVNFFFTG